MKLSIITINLNNKIGLQKTIESVICQNFKDYEFLVIDGDSTDGSKDLIEKYKGQITNFISESDTGVYHAMNKGILKAQGKYLLFLNSGDFLVDDNVLSEALNVDHDSDILCGRCNVSKNGKVIWTSNPPEKISFGTLYKEGLAHQSTFIKKQLFDQLGLYREDFKYNSDIDFWFKTIIINNVSTEKLNLIISDYNLDGISSKENQTEQYKNEMRIILSQSNFSKFIPDYESWNNERKSMELYFWAQNNKIINSIINFLYDIAVLINKTKK